jgi:hypothetical protein
VRNAAGVEIGGMVLFLKGGELLDDDYTFPTVECVTWESSKAT